MSREINVNRKIRAPEVRVIDASGKQIGIMPLAEALRLAESQALDLVEISPTARPPVCRIMDYGKYKYEQAKKAQEARRKQAATHMKEIKVRPKTDEHDLEYKLRNVRRFLEEGSKTKITVVFRGRELAHPEFGQRMLERVSAELKDIATIEQMPRMEGRTLSMIVAPKG
ncbi:MAG TPA: translation initiation factor IF-3 [Thermodesulfobacteriota bacterium]|nr:translation initiation factor IF-3 [Thermodesulfobacteriota bacterium]